MKTYICAEGHIQYSASPVEPMYFPGCSRASCKLEVVELPPMILLPPSRLEDQVRVGHG